MARAKDDEFLIELTVRLMEIDDAMPARHLVYKINGANKLMDSAGEEQPIRTVTAYLSNTAALSNEGIHLLEPYDIRRQHLADSIIRIFEFGEYAFLPSVVKKKFWRGRRPTRS